MTTTTHTTHHGDIDTFSVHALLELNGINARSLAYAHAISRIASLIHSSLPS